MDCFYIITNSVKDKELLVTHKISNYLKEHGKSCVVQQSDHGNNDGSFHYTDVSQIPENVDCVIVLGGDGTLLQAARDVVDRQLPLFGINLGTLGYLAEIDQYSVYPALDHLMGDDYEIERRMMLCGSVYHNGELLEQDIALNDIVISRERSLCVVKFHNYVNDEFLNSYNADGIIIATPTGSTGYSLSAGGPIISPDASMILMTPLAPHTLNTRSIVFSDNDKITVEIGPGRDEMIERGMAAFDGDTTVPMVTGDRIVIEKSTKDTRIIKINNVSFLETLRKKMNNS
ncbi:NAD(+)/NADH kinase [Ruminococcus sp. OA3]|uniref:NAD(+)/NADH kinase n=1 Tax=Ruminococcus sp. OA3 TaxID=2914164 RepID=UPI001F05EEF2|nr:NAD(+)/NADH kinase [Ruminococcus sp. OA3]MCH1983763.1 NAD(+)/NADH kinase [Ruminococcus sp. OA3]